MSHYGLLRDYRLTGDVEDIRGAALYGPDDEKIGKINDVIFDHASGTIQYAVIDAGGWLSSKKFLVPAEHIRPRANHPDDFATDMTKDAIKSLPEYDEKHVSSDKHWDRYSQRYRESLESGPVLHKGTSTHIITPTPDELPATGEPLPHEEDFDPQRLVGKFPDAAPDPSKIRLRPQGAAARAEDSAIAGQSVPEEIPTRMEDDVLDQEALAARQQPRDTLMHREDTYISEGGRHRRWTAFQDHLRQNRVDITANCGSCASAKDKVA